VSERTMEEQWAEFRKVLDQPGAKIVCHPGLLDAVIERGKVLPGLIRVETCRWLEPGTVLAVAPQRGLAMAPDPFTPSRAPSPASDRKAGGGA
jgi:hypothetical protein